MNNVRHSEDRGRSVSDWLVSRHSLSFGDYDDPNHRQFRRMQVLNDDIILAGSGFDSHSHEDVEIVSYIVRGQLAHRDSTGNSGTLEAGDVQRISAGEGIVHEEYNGSKEDPLRLVQIWFSPRRPGLSPDYEQRHFSRTNRRNRFRLLVSPRGRDASVRINSDIRIYRGLFDPGRRARFEVPTGRGAWFHLVDGEAQIDDTPVSQGDAVAVESAGEVSVLAETDAEFLVIDSA